MSDNLPHPKIIQTLLKMQQEGKLDPANVEIARHALAVRHPNAVQLPEWEEKIIAQLMDRGLSREAALEQLEAFS